MDKKELILACDSLEYGIVRELTRFVRDNGTDCTPYERESFGLDCDEDDGRRVTRVLNFYDGNGCFFFEPDRVNQDGFEGVSDGDLKERLYEHAVHTAYQCLYIVMEKDGTETLRYYRFTNGGIVWDDDQAEPDHGDCLGLSLVDLHYILLAINTNF